MPLRQGIRDFFLYILVGVGLVTTVLFLALLLPNISHAWFIFGCATLFLCIFVSRMYWKQRRSSKLWILLTLLLAGHVALHAIVFERLPRFPTFLFLLTVPMEIMLVATIVKLGLNIMPGAG